MKRRLAALLIAMLLASGCTAHGAGKTKYAHSVFDIFDTVFHLTYYADGNSNDIAQVFESEARRLHAVFDRYNEHMGVMGLYALNASGGLWIEVEPELYEVLSLCQTWSPIGGGRVNIALGGVIDIWNQYRREGVALPSMQELEAAAPRAGAAYELEDGNRVQLADADTVIDLGAVAKGWIAEHLAVMMDGLCPEYLIDAGGNIRMGTRSDGSLTTWNIGIVDPFDTSQIALVISGANMSAVTSGSYQRYYELDGIRYHHIIDPDTLMPGNFVAQVTILCADSALADYLSTAIFLLPYAEGRELIEGLDGVDAVWIQHDGRVDMTDGALTMVVDES